MQTTSTIPNLTTAERGGSCTIGTNTVGIITKDLHSVKETVDGYLKYLCEDTGQQLDECQDQVIFRVLADPTNKANGISNENTYTETVFVAGSVEFPNQKKRAIAKNMNLFLVR